MFSFVFTGFGALLFSKLVFLVTAKDIRRAFFLLDDNVPGYNLANSILQDKKLSECAKNETCQSVVKRSTDRKQSSVKWSKNTDALLENIRSLASADCLDLRLAGEIRSGVFPMIINGKLEHIPCDMTTDGGGWTIFQRRVDGTVDFTQNWESYKRGFGDRAKNFWLGLDLIHHMISQSKSEIRIDLFHFLGGRRYAKYGYVDIGAESEAYRLKVLEYSGTAGDSLEYHNGMEFSTYDRDHDIHSQMNCAANFKTGFWLKRCLWANPNGLYLDRNQTSPQYISWKKLSGFGGVTYIDMKFRRRYGGR